MRYVNSLALGLIFKLDLVIDGWGISCEIALRWMALNHADHKITLVQVMACCRQATSLYLSQCWHSYIQGCRKWQTPWTSPHTAHPNDAINYWLIIFTAKIVHQIICNCSHLWFLWSYGNMIQTTLINDKMGPLIQWNPSGKAGNVSLKLQNLVHFHAPFFTNHAYFTPHDRPPLLKGHHLGWPLQRGSTVCINGVNQNQAENILKLVLRPKMNFCSPGYMPKWVNTWPSWVPNSVG